LNERRAPSVKEQIESLGGKFIEVSYDTDEEKEAAVGVGGYAKPMPASWLARQQVEVAKRVALADIVISTALIPGRAAPTLITEDMVKSMTGFGHRRHRRGQGGRLNGHAAATARCRKPTRRS
jgi:NAD/NADP transhydrogenase alpha subunit